MRNPLQALVWELWRLSRLELLTRLGMVLAVPLLILMANQYGKQFSDPETDVLRGVLVMVTLVSAGFSVTWFGALDRNSEFRFQQGFTRPLTTRAIVLIPIWYSIVISLLTYLVSALAIDVLLGFSIPYWSPLPLLICYVCVFIACVWSPTQPLGKLLCLTVGVAAMQLWLAGLHLWEKHTEPVIMSIGRLGYFERPWYFQSLFLLVAVLAAVFTIRAVGYQRCGEGWRWGFLSLLRPRWWATARKFDWPWRKLPSVTPNRVFNGALSASWWYETRRTGVLIRYAIVVLPLFVLLFVTLGTWTYGQAERAPMIWLAAVLLCPLAYQLIATDGAVGLRQRQGVVDLSPFDATRPMRCDQVIAIKLLAVAGWSIAGCAVTSLFALGYTLLVNGWQDWGMLLTKMSGDLGHVSVWWWMGAILGVVCQFTSTTALLLAGILWLTLHPRLFVSGLCFVGIIGLLLARDASHGWQWRSWWMGFGYLLLALTIATSLWAIARAVRSNFLSTRYFVGVFLVWSMYVITTLGLTLTALPQTIVIPPLVWLAAIALLLLPLASSAFAPLALAAHRHA